MYTKENSKKVIIDLDALFDFVFGSEERNVESMMEERYVSDGTNGEMSLVEKTKSEAKMSDHSHHEDLRYSFINEMISTLDEVGCDGNGIPSVDTFGQEVAYNTLFRYGILRQA